MIVAVCGGKGGVGRSTVALNLGHELDGIVVDADLATPDLPHDGGPDLHDVLAGRCEPTTAVRGIGPVRLVPAGRTLSGSRAADASLLAPTLRRLERERDPVVVDCPAGLARDVGAVLEAADAAVLVAAPAATALTDALRTRRLVRALRTPVAAVVLNRGTDADASTLRPALGETVVVPERSAVGDAWARDRPVRAAHPSSTAAERFAALARTVDRWERRADRSGGRLTPDRDRRDP